MSLFSEPDDDNKFLTSLQMIFILMLLSSYTSLTFRSYSFILSDLLALMHSVLYLIYTLFFAKLS